MRGKKNIDAGDGGDREQLHTLSRRSAAGGSCAARGVLQARREIRAARHWRRPHRTCGCNGSRLCENADIVRRLGGGFALWLRGRSVASDFCSQNGALLRHDDIHRRYNPEDLHRLKYRLMFPATDAPLLARRTLPFDDLDLTLQMFYSSLGDGTGAPIGSIQARQIPGNALLELLHPGLQLVLGEVPIPAVDCFELAAIDGHQGIGK